MNLITFDMLRTLNLPGIRYIKPEHMFVQQAEILAADCLLFAEYWQINALHFGFNKPIFPSLSSYLIGHNKIEMTRCFLSIAAAHVPFTLIEPNTTESADRVWHKMDLPFVAKLPKSSMGDGVFLIANRNEWKQYLQLTDIIYVQEYLPIDRDLRIVWAGNKIVGGYWRLQSNDGFHNNIAKGGQIVHGPIPEEAARLVELLATKLKIDHGGFDIAMVGQHPFVFEFNRLFGTQGLLGNQHSIDTAILEHLQQQWGEDDPGRPRSPTLPVAV